jgi:hypothetical protein
MAASATRIEIDARDREAAVIDYLHTLLRHVWEDLDTAGVTTIDEGSENGAAVKDALCSLSLAQEMVKELDGLADRPRPRL